MSKYNMQSRKIKQKKKLEKIENKTKNRKTKFNFIGNFVCYKSKSAFAYCANARIHETQITCIKINGVAFGLYLLV